MIHPEKELTLAFTCPVCMDDHKVDIESGITYSDQCESGKHFLCNDCTEKCKAVAFEARRNYRCVICKHLIAKYVQPERTDSEREQESRIDQIRREVRTEQTRNQAQDHIHNQCNSSLPLGLAFHFAFVFTFFIVFSSGNVSQKIMNFFIGMNVAFGIFYFIHCIFRTNQVQVVAIR